MSISGLTISHETSSFSNYGTVNLSSCTFTQNSGSPQGGAIDNVGTMTITSSTCGVLGGDDGGCAAREKRASFESPPRPFGMYPRERVRFSVEVVARARRERPCLSSSSS